MARLVTHDDRSPLKIDAEDVDPEKGDVAICRCGLADSYPFCDGSHRATHDEEEGELYRYVEDDSHDSDGDTGTDAGADSRDGDDSRPRRVVERIVDAEE